MFYRISFTAFLLGGVVFTHDTFAEDAYPVSVEFSDGSVAPHKLAPLGVTQDGFVMKWDAIGHTWVPAPDEVGEDLEDGGVFITRGKGLVDEGSTFYDDGVISVNTGNGPGQIPAFNEDKILIFNNSNTIELHDQSKLTFKSSAEEFILGMFNDILKLRNAATNTTIFEVTGNNFLIQGKQVCLTDGTNCPWNENFISSISVGEGLAPFGTTITDTGSISIADGGVTAAKLNQMGASSGQVLKWNGSSWAPAVDSDTVGVQTEVDPGVQSFAHMDGFAPEVCDEDQTLKYDTAGTLTCSNIVLKPEQIESAMSDALAGKQDVVDSTTELSVKSIKFMSGATWMGFRSQPSSGNVIWDLPLADGADGQVLKTDGAGVLSWTSIHVKPGSISDADISSTAAIDQSKIKNLETDLGLKEPVIAFPNDTAKYWRGDKSWQDLNTTAISEGTNKYFTEERVLDTQLTGLTPVAGTVSESDSVLTAIEKISGNLSGFILKSGSSMSGDLDMGGNTVTGLKAPQDGSDAATKSYVDGVSYWKLDSGNISKESGKVGIGTAAPAAVLDIASTTSGILIPRMTIEQINAISSPAGMQVYNITTNELNYHNGASWKALGVVGSSITSISAGTGLTADTTGTSSTIGITPNGVTSTELADDSVTNEKVSSTAAIDRSKLASGSANHILVNNSSGVMSSVATLPVSQGGTGINTLTASRLYISNSSGSGFEVLNCASFSYLTFDITGTPVCTSLPVAASGASGIVSNTAQTFSGLKTFENGFKIGTSATVCDSEAEGTFRFNGTSKSMEFCNGISWKKITGTSGSLTISSPSTATVSNGAVEYLVSYGPDTESVNLTAGMVSIIGSDTTDCTVSVLGAGLTRTVRVENCSGTGTVAIYIAEGSGTSTSGNPTPARGPSSTFLADNLGPNAPTDLALGTVPSNISSTPQIFYTNALDVGGSKVVFHEVKVLKTSDSSVVLDWTPHRNSSAIYGLTLAYNTQYSIIVRAKDAVGNIGPTTSAINWTTIKDICDGVVAPGTQCAGGAIFAGTLNFHKYMTTPGNCSQIPAAQKVAASLESATYPSADFTPTCSGGTDTLTKTWNNGTSTNYDIPMLTNYTTKAGIGYGASNIDLNLGDANASHIVAITSTAQGGPHAAARYCDKLVYGGYSDWYLPNRQELYLMYTNRALILGFDVISGIYFSSTEGNDGGAWSVRFSNGNQSIFGKMGNMLIRCIRRF